MSALTWGIIVAVILIGAFVWYCASLATRLDRLHWRILTTRDQLDRLAIRRATQARTLVAAGVLDSPASDEVDAAAAACLADVDVMMVNDGLARPLAEALARPQDPVSTARRTDHESALTQALRAHLDNATRDRLSGDPRSHQLLEDLDMASYRVRLARSMHNTDVTQVLRLRRKPVVRLFHLYGRAVAPQMVDFDDDIRPEPTA